MKLTCFVINIKSRQKTLLSSLKTAANLEITGVVENLDMFLYKLLPMDFDPDIVVIDYKSFNAHYGHFYLLWKRCRCILLTDARNANTIVLDQAFDHDLEISDGPDSYKYLQGVAKGVSSGNRQDEEYGWHTIEDGWLEFEMRNERRTQLDWKDILEIRRTPVFTYLSLTDIT